MAIGTAAILGTAVLGAGAFSAISQAKAGNQQAKSLVNQGEFNAQVYEQQAEMILNQKKLSDYQYHRTAARSRGAIVSHAAGAGFDFGGSPLAIAIDNESQLLLDKATSDYNLDVEANFAKSGATYQRGTAYQQAQLSRTTGYSNAFSTILNTGTNLGMLNLRAGRL